MKQLLFLVFLLTACTPIEKHSDQANCTEDSFICKEHLPIDILDRSSEKHLQVVTLSSRIDSMILFASLCQADYCNDVLADAKLFRSSNNKQYFLSYDPVTEINSLYNRTGALLGKIKLAANNAEFFIKTLPLEEESGILLIDGLYAFKKYELKQNQLVQAFEIKFNTQDQYQQFLVLNGENKLLCLKRDPSQKKSIVEIYDLQNGKLFSSKTLDKAYNNIKYDATDQLLAFHNRNSIYLTDVLLAQEAVFVDKELPIEAFVFEQKARRINGLLKSKNTFEILSVEDTVLHSINYQLNSKLQIQQVFKTDQYWALHYFETNTPNQLTNDTQTLKQGLIIISPKSDKIYRISLDPKPYYQIIANQKKDMLYLKTDKNLHSISLYKLEQD